MMLVSTYWKATIVFSTLYMHLCYPLMLRRQNTAANMSKRSADSGDSSSQPPIKKVQFEPIFIGPISTLEEMDMKVLQFQNKKLAQVRVYLMFLWIIFILLYDSITLICICLLCICICIYSIIFMH